LYTGEEPYNSDKFKTPWQIAQFVTAGNRLEIPKDLPPEIIELINKCWDNDPSARPDFEYCVDVLTKFSTLYGSASKGAPSKSKKHGHEHHKKDKKSKKSKKEGEPTKEKKKKKKKTVEPDAASESTASSAPAEQTSDTSSSSSSSVAF